MSPCRFVRTTMPVMLALALIVPEAAAEPPNRSAPGAPTNLRIAATGPGSVTLAWDKPASGGSVYYYGVSESPTFNWYSVPAFTPPGTAPCASYHHPFASRWPITILLVDWSMPANLKSKGPK